MGLLAYQLQDHTISYENFSALDINDDLLQESQIVIGSNWRDVFNGTTTANTYYILKDANQIYYKIRFLDLLSESGQRGFPRFEYKLLQ